MKKYVMLLLVSLLFVSGCSSNKLSTDQQKTMLDDTLAQIKEVYGEHYEPNMEIASEQLEEVYGIDMENVEYAVAEGPMTSVSADLFIGLVAKEGKVEAVKEDVEAYQDYLVNESMQYPMNVAKVKASQVVVVEDVVYLIVLGKMDDRESVSDEDALAFAQEEVQKAVDVINEVFN